MTCDVCNKNEAKGVASVPAVPISVAYCQECLDANAHPYWIIVANTALCDGYDETCPEWQNMVNDTLKHLGKTRAEFDEDVKKDIEKLRTI